MMKNVVSHQIHAKPTFPARWPTDGVSLMLVHDRSPRALRDAEGGQNENGAKYRVRLNTRAAVPH